MFINEYGDKNNLLVLLLAPMMVSGEDLYKLMHPFFKGLAHAELVMMFPERFANEVKRFLEE